jgi:outer membrane protein
MKKIALLAAVAACAISAQASAAAGDWMVRARAIAITPDEESTINIGGKADFNNQIVPELDFSYFFTDNIAAELILATAKHNATAEGTALGDVDVGSAWVLPPTLTLQYHFTNFEHFKPYLGAGINYTIYYNQDPGALNSIDIDNAFGLALQAGVDVPINEKWGWNIDVKRIFVDADAKWNGGAVTADIDLDPWVIGTGISYKF